MNNAPSTKNKAPSTKNKAPFVKPPPNRISLSGLRHSELKEGCDAAFELGWQAGCVVHDLQKVKLYTISEADTLARLDTAAGLHLKAAQALQATLDRIRAGIVVEDEFQSITGGKHWEDWVRQVEEAGE